MFQGNNQFYYHTDHLGSATLVTDDDADVVQQIAYLPYGEDWVDIRHHGYFGSAYKFNGKEKDDETGYSYYGARYYTDRLSIWLSVDPLADKYPHLSPYAYCSDNPIMRIDPDGMEDKLVIVGRQSEMALNQMRKGTTMTLDYNERTGEVTTKSLPRTEIDKKLYDVINSDVVSVEIEAENAIEKTLDSGRKINAYKIDGRFVETSGGIFGGNDIYTDSEGNKKVRACQYVCPSLLEEFDNCAGTAGQAILHEAKEAYTGALISIENDTPAGVAFQGSQTFWIYNKAHENREHTVKQPCED